MTYIINIISSLSLVGIINLVILFSQLDCFWSMPGTLEYITKSNLAKFIKHIHQIQLMTKI